MQVTHDPINAPDALFRREGEYWTIGFAGRLFRLKHTKGLACIAYLLRHPETEFHALDLGASTDDNPRNGGEPSDAAGSVAANRTELEALGIHVGGLGDAGEMLDDQAKASYRARIGELRDELEDAHEFGNSEAAARAEDEISALTAELSRAVGLRGRNRRGASAAERARQRIKKAIRSAIARIAKNDRELGAILSNCIRTGTYCSYVPNRGSPVEWRSGPAAPSLDQPAAPTAATVDPGEQAIADTSRAAVLCSSRSTFAGRESELRQLRTLIGTAQQGQGSLVLICGGPGVGKTRLALEAASYAAARGFGFLIGHCYEREGARPYLPFAEILEMGLREAPTADQFRSAIADNAGELARITPRLRRLYPDLPPVLDLPPQETRRDLFQTICETLGRVAHRLPLFLVLDDLHWAHEATLALLVHLAYRLPQLPIAIVGTYRDTDLEMGSPLARTLDEFHRGSISTIRLHGLSEAEVHKLLHGLSNRAPTMELVRLIFDETRGNPFFVEELYRYLTEEKHAFDSAEQFRPDFKLGETDVPDSVRLVVGRRLERLGTAGKRVLTAAAILGRSFSFKLLETVLAEVDVDELLSSIEQAQRMGLLVSSSEGAAAPFEFSHEIIRQTLLADISLPRRQRLHLRTADALEKLHARFPVDAAADIALHLTQAGAAADPERTLNFLRMAGSAALEAGAYETALNYFESALSRCDERDRRDRAELIYRLAIAERGLGRWDEANRRWNEALNIFCELDDPESIGRVSFRIANALVWQGRYAQASEVALRALSYLAGSVSEERARLLAALGLSKAVEGEHRQAEDAFNGALNLADQLADKSLHGAILAFRVQANFFFLRLRETLEDSRKCAELLPGSGPWPRAQRLCWTQAALYHVGRPKEAARLREELDPLATRLGHVAALSWSTRIAAWTEFGERPDLARLIEILNRDLEANRSAGLEMFGGVSQAQLSIAEFYRGCWDRSLEYVQAGPEHKTNALPTFSLGVIFRQKAYAGDRAGALALLPQISERLPGSKQAHPYGSWAMLLLVIEGLNAIDQREHAARFYPLVRELIETATVCVALASRFPQTVAGIAAAAARNWDAAEEHFQTAERQAQDFPHLVELAEAHRFHGAALLNRGYEKDRERARELLIGARSGYLEAGMPRHVEITDALLNSY